MVDDETGLSAPKLSALSVLVYRGPSSLKDLARAEQVTAPTMSKLVADLEADGLAAKRADREDKRGLRIEVTARGRALFEEGRRRRLALLRNKVAQLAKAEQSLLGEAAALMLRIAAED
ncbi:MAG: MarR family transcriptional regulator [Proteobacteria bacterium]|nr:MarR family transcriptional regulator [Pseudomonadota bacterium]